jgi:Mn2+/Fe2+ NRAMP family transporter
MTRKHQTVRRIARRLWPSPERFAAAGALQDPNLLLQLQAAQSNGNRPAAPPRSSRRPIGEAGGALLLVAAVALALSAGIGATAALLIASRAFDGALLDQAKVGILATALLTPALTVFALASLRRPAGRLVLSSPCAA